MAKAVDMAKLLSHVRERGHGRMGGLGCGCGGLRDYDPDPPGPPNILNQLVATLCDASLQANPQCLHRHRPDARYPGHRNPQGIGNNELDEQDDGPHIKIPPPIFKGLPGEWPDAHLLATEDWMEVMHVQADDCIDKFKHTLQYLAREWYHGLYTDHFGCN